jgi:outer membrane biosynthesis protein TonB
VSVGARRNFDAQDVTIACATALLAQLVFVAVFSMPSPKLVQADISNDNAQPIAVAITPVLKLGSKNPANLPSKWQRKQPVAAKTQPQSPLPSTKAEKTASAIPTTSASAAAPVIDAGKVEPAAPAGSSAATVASTEGSEQGAANGTETDPLKARAADSYRQTLIAWFGSHLQIRGKIPFDELKKLHVSTRVEISPDRKVSGFTILKPSGDPILDDEVKATLTRIQSSGIELPAPPPMYPDFLGSSLPVGFQCTVRAQCE